MDLWRLKGSASPWSTGPFRASVPLLALLVIGLLQGLKPASITGSLPPQTNWSRPAHRQHTEPEPASRTSAKNCAALQCKWMDVKSLVPFRSYCNFIYVWLKDVRSFISGYMEEEIQWESLRPIRHIVEASWRRHNSVTGLKHSFIPQDGSVITVSTANTVWAH